MTATPAAPPQPAAPPKPPPPKPVDRSQYAVVSILGFAATAGLALLVLRHGDPVDTSQAQAAAGVLALVTGLAIAIERVLEGFWTLVDVMANNPSWPFSKDAELLKQFAAHLGAYVKDPLERLDTAIKSADDSVKSLAKAKPDAQQQVGSLLKSVDDILGADPKAKQSRSLSSLQLGLADLSKALGDQQIGADLNLGVSVLDTLSGWIDTLVGNPGRKIMSLFAGVGLGLAGAWLLHLDLVHAALSVKVGSYPFWGVVLTGVAVGLGSNPTHELIKAIQTYKQERQQAV